MRCTLFLYLEKDIVNQSVAGVVFGCAVWHTACLIENMVCNVTIYNFSTVLVFQARHSSMCDEKTDIIFSSHDGIGNGICGAMFSAVSQKDITLSFTAVRGSVVKASIVFGCIAYRFFSTMPSLFGYVTVPYGQQKHLRASISMLAEKIVEASCFVLSCLATREG